MRNLIFTANQSAGGRAASWWTLILLLVGLATFAGCSSDSPTAPQQTPGPSPPGPSAAWNVAVSVSPNQLAAGTTTPSVVTFTVRRQDNGQPPPDGTTLVVSTTLGDLGSVASGVQAANIALFGGSAQVLLFPGDIEGTAQVRAQIESSFGSAIVTVRGAIVFFLSGVSPSFGDPAGGEPIEITGGGIVAPVRVLIDGVVAQVTSVSSTRLRAITPSTQVAAGQTRRVNVEVTSDLGGETEASDTLVGAFTYGGGPAPVPIQLFSVSPNSGPNEGGTQIVIAGQGFEAPVQVLFGQGSPQAFNGIEAIVESVTSTEIVARSPSATGFGQDNRDQSVTVLVRNRESGEGDTIASGFRYGVNILITSISPAIGPPEGGQRVTIFGQGFDEPVAVSIENVGGQPILSVTGTEVIFRTAAVQQLNCQDITGDVSVTNVETGATATGPGYTYEIDATAPIITSISPTTGPVAGNTAVTISGANFARPIRVTVNGSLAPVDSVSSTAVVFRSPFLAIEDVSTETCDDDGDGTDGERFVDTVVDFDVALTLLENGCEDTVAVGFVYQPADRSCRNDAGPPPPVTPPPSADFSFEIAGADNVVTFNNESDASDDTTWLWDFGDGGSSTAENPVHIYGAAASGMTFIVRLTATNSAGSDFRERAVVIP